MQKESETFSKADQISSQISGFIRLPEVLKLLPVSKSTFWARVKSGDYPTPVKISPRVSAWRVGEINALINKLSNQ